MPSIEQDIKLIDKFSGPLKRMAAQTENVIVRMERMQRLASGGLGFDKVPKIQKEIEKKQEDVTSEVEKSNKAAKGFGSTLKGLITTYLTLQGVSAFIGSADAYTNTAARLNIINDGLRTNLELQNDIFAAAERSRGSYSEMAGAISRMGILAAEAFSNNDEVLAFTELVQKSFRVGGSSTMEQQAGMYQLSQAMAAGKLQGDEFRSIMENAPLIADAIAKFTGRSKGELKEMSAEGEITADIIKGAMFFMADDINSKLDTMPKTFGDVATQMGNDFISKFGKIFERLNGFLNSDIGQRLVSNLTGSIDIIASGFNSLLTIIINMTTFMINNWDRIINVLGLATAAMTALYIVSKSQAIAAAALAVKNGVLTAITIGQTVATVGLTAAWHGLNAAMKANVIILIISLIVGLVMWVIDLWKTNDDFAIGFMKVWHGILNFFDKIPAYFWTLVDAIMQPFTKWATNLSSLFDSVINGIIGGINSVLKLVNKVTGSSYEIQGSFSMTEVANKMSDFTADKKDKAYEKALKKEAERAAELENFISKREARNLTGNEANNIGSSIDYSKFAVDTTTLAGGKIDEVGKIKDKVDISSEDLKTMRELAEINSIQNFVTLQPNFSFGDTNIRQDGRSLDEIIKGITKSLNEELASSAKGVYGVG